MYNHIYIYICIYIQTYIYIYIYICIYLVGQENDPDVFLPFSQITSSILENYKNKYRVYRFSQRRKTLSYRFLKI